MPYKQKERTVQRPVGTKSDPTNCGWDSHATGTSTVATSNQNVGYTPNQGLGSSDRRYTKRGTRLRVENSCGKTFSRSRHDERETRTHAPPLPLLTPCCRTPTLTPHPLTRTEPHSTQRGPTTVTRTDPSPAPIGAAASRPASRQASSARKAGAHGSHSSAPSPERAPSMSLPHGL